jgi:hypothetical protein
MKRILLNHPSRGRPTQLVTAFEDFINNSSHTNPITYIVSIDMDDPEMQGYLTVMDILYAQAKAVPDVKVQLLVNDNKTVVQAVNRAYTAENLDNHDIISMISDDFRMPRNWDTSVIAEFDKYGYDKIIKTHQPGGRVDLITIQMAGTQFWRDYGTFFYHEYISMYADDDITGWARLTGRVIDAPHIVCLHLHPYIGLPGSLPFDATYERENQPMHHQVGHQIYERRKANGFR